MSVSYRSEKVTKNSLIESRGDNRSHPLSRTIEFSKPDKKTVNKSVDVMYYTEERIEITFRGYEEQAEIDMILDVFELMLGTKFHEN